MTWDKFWAAIAPSVQSLVYAIVAFAVGGGGVFALATGPRKVATLEPVSEMKAPARPAVDHTRTQLVAIEGTVGLCVDEIREFRKDWKEARNVRSAKGK